MDTRACVRVRVRVRNPKVHRCFLANRSSPDVHISRLHAYTAVLAAGHSEAHRGSHILCELGGLQACSLEKLATPRGECSSLAVGVEGAL